MDEAILAILIPVVVIGGFLLMLRIGGYIEERKRAKNPITLKDLNIDPEVMHDLEFQKAVEFGQTMNAMKRYRALTNVELSEAQEIVQYLEKHPDDMLKLKKKSGVSVEPSDEGIRELLRNGSRQKAIDIYRQFTGSSLSEAKEAIERIEIDMNSVFEDEGVNRRNSYGNS